jgi:exoribonuclease II
MEELNTKIYPIGKVSYQEFTKDVLYRSILMVDSAPIRLRQRVSTLNTDELEMTYREGGWCVRQLVHHLADSHMNMWIRFKHTLTLPKHTIMPYDEKIWAEMQDYKTAPIESSLLIFEGVQQRFSALLKTISADGFSKSYYHPEYKTDFTLAEATQLYAWHGLHHTAQIEGIFK